MSAHRESLTIVQYAGDFREASHRLNGLGAENYRAQRYTVDFVEGLASRYGAVTTITGFTEEAYDEVLPSGARAIGAGFRDRFDPATVISLIEQTSPDRLILRTPSLPLMRWAMRRRCRTLLLLADSLTASGWRSRLRQTIMLRTMRSPTFEIVANHGRRAAAQLVAAGVPADKVIAWDYPALNTPHERPIKSASSAEPLIVFVGALTAEKGVEDLIAAAALIIDEGVSARVDLIGKGDVDWLKTTIARYRVGHAVQLVGTVGNEEVIPRMAAADVVIVASRHSYPEGLPLTIYEAFCSRTPLVASDHPMFVDNVVHEESGLIFGAGDPTQLAERIMRLVEQPALYEAISRAGAIAWDRLQLPVKWGELIDHWLDDGEDAQAWLSARTMAAG